MVCIKVPVCKEFLVKISLFYKQNKSTLISLFFLQLLSYHRSFIQLKLGFNLTFTVKLAVLSASPTSLSNSPSSHKDIKVSKAVLMIFINAQYRSESYKRDYNLEYFLLVCINDQSRTN